MPSWAEIHLCAEILLNKDPSPISAQRLLRDVLSIEIVEEKLGVGSLQVRLLEDEQREDGSWGAFHSRDTSSKQKIATTEAGVERALCLGLDRDHPIVAKAKNYILSIMRGEIRFPDYNEKNDRWPTGMRLFLASTLASIDPSHQILDQDRSLWREIAIRTFRSGSYSSEDEIAAHASLTGATVKDSYLVINNRYTLNVLGSGKDLLPVAVEGCLLAWLQKHERGIGYLDIPLGRLPSLSKPGSLDRWFTSLEMLTRLFPRSAHQWDVWIDWIWDQQDSTGLWDFGPRCPSSVFFPLADDWRRRGQRNADWSTRVLLLAASHAKARSRGLEQ